MLRIFGGMIIGSIITIMLLGGTSAADQVLVNAQTLYFDQINRPDTTTTLLLLGILSIILVSLTTWQTQTVLDNKKLIENLRRHCL
jgi:formate/nitrite transporter FocA (FNT family)